MSSFLTLNELVGLREIKVKEKRQKNLISLICVGVFLGSLLVSLLSFSFHKNTKHHVYYFKSYDSGKICSEVRYSDKKEMQEEIGFFVDEILLGPMTNRLKNLFVLGTKKDFCFLDGKTLYVGISKDALFAVDEKSSIRGSIDLLKKNIKRNFRNIRKIYIYIDGKRAFCEE